MSISLTVRLENIDIFFKIIINIASKLCSLALLTKNPNFHVFLVKILQLVISITGMRHPTLTPNVIFSESCLKKLNMCIKNFKMPKLGTF